MTPRELMDVLNPLHEELAKHLGFQVNITMENLAQPPQPGQAVAACRKYLEALATIEFECQYGAGANRN